MAKILITPGKYVQGAGELKKLGTYAAAYGKKALILISAGGQKRIGKLVEDSFSAANTAMEFVIFNGECSKTEIERLRGVMQASGFDMVIGIGGGKIFDTAKLLLTTKRHPSSSAPPSLPQMLPAALCRLFTAMKVYLKNICSCPPTPIWF